MGKILIVDDDWLNVEVIQLQLESEGYTVDSASSGEEALTQIKTAPPDVILLDVRMTGMDGYETCKVIKADEQTRHIPVIIVTGFRDDADIRKAIAAGVDDILFKPIQSPLMMMRIKTMAHMKSLEDALRQR